MKLLLLYFISLNLISSNVEALEVIKMEHARKYLDLNIIRVDVSSFGAYTLTNHNLIEMTLVCANNVVYDYNKTAIIRYRNFYNLPVFDFKIESNTACQEMGRFIESTFMAVDEERPFLIRLNIKTGMVDKIIYPNIDRFTDDGEIEDLLPKKRLLLAPKSLKNKKIPIKNQKIK
jgi:hypothetical protein